LALLAVGAIALTADRWIFSDGAAVTDPATALGQHAPQSAVSAPVSLDSLRGMSIPELPFPHHLPTPDHQEPIRDLFAPPERVLEKDPSPGIDAGRSGPRGDKQAADKSDSSGDKSADSDTFVSQHRLNGVLIDESLKIAIVDGAWVRVGESVTGCTLLKVSGNEVRFKCSDGEAVLKVSQTRTPGQD
jgi:hypothetical protein